MEDHLQCELAFFFTKSIEESCQARPQRTNEWRLNFLHEIFLAQSCTLNTTGKICMSSVGSRPRRRLRNREVIGCATTQQMRVNRHGPRRTPRSITGRLSKCTYCGAKGRVRLVLRLWGAEHSICSSDWILTTPVERDEQFHTYTHAYVWNCSRYFMRPLATPVTVFHTFRNTSCSPTWIQRFRIT